jgi:acyl-CoA thioester hydrolase
MGIANNARYMDWFSEGRTKWLLDRGHSYAEMEKDGLALPLIQADVTYKNAARFQETLRLETRCTKMTRRTMEFSYHLYRESVLLCTAKTRHVFWSDGKAVRVDADWIQELQSQVESEDSE